MTKLLLIFLLISTSSFAQLNLIGPIEYSGYVESIRTVHFSDDGTKVLGDWDALVEWDIASQTMVSQVEIPGYSTNKSSYDGSSFWMNGNSNYNSEAKDISDMHDNINVSDSSGMTAHKTDRPYGLSALISGTKDAVVLASTEKHTFQVVRLNTETLEETTMYFDENRDGAAVPTAIKISSDGKYLGISLAGENSGMRIYNLESGALLHRRKTDSDANDLAFSGDAQYIFVNDGAALVHINTTYWREINIWDLKGTITSLDANSDGSYVVMAYEKKGAVLMNLRNGSVEATLSSGKIMDVTFSKDNRHIGLGVDKKVKKEGSASVILYQVVE